MKKTRVNIKHTLTDHWRLLGVCYVVNEWAFGFIFHELDILTMLVLVPLTIFSAWTTENFIGKEAYHGEAPDDN